MIKIERFNINEKDNCSYTALHYCENLNIKFIISFDYISVLLKASIGGFHEVAGLLINNEKCDINEKDFCDQRALHLAEYFNIKFIISFDYISVLFKASIGGFHEVAGLLINNEKCDINEKDFCDRTALHLGEY